MDLLNNIIDLYNQPFNRKEENERTSKDNLLNLAGLSISRAVKNIFISEGRFYSTGHIRKNIYELKIKVTSASKTGKNYPKTNYIVEINDKIYIEDKEYLITGTYERIENKVNDNAKDKISKEDIYEEILLTYLNTSRETDKLESVFDDTLNSDEINLLIAFHVRFYDCFKNNNFKSNVIKFIDDKCKNIYSKLNIKNNDPDYKKIDMLHNKQEDIERKLRFALINLNDPYKVDNFQREFRSIIHSLESNSLFKPFFNKELIVNATLDTMFKPFLQVLKSTAQEHKYSIFNKCHNNFDEFIEKAKDAGGKTTEYLVPLGETLLNLFKQEVFGESSGKADLIVVSLDKKYPLHTRSFNYHIKIKNSGNGFASNIKLTAKSEDLVIDNFCFEKNSLKNDIVIKLPINDVINKDKPKIHFNLEWTNLDYQNNNREFILQIEEQAKDIPWQELRNKQPYMLVAITEKEKLLGRDEILNELVQNITSNNITSFVIYGQKRVGKTSVVKTFEKYFNDLNNNVIIAYVDSTSQKQEEVDDTVNRLVQGLCKDIKKKLLKKYKDNLLFTKILEIEIPPTNNSLTPIEDFIDNLELILNEIKIVLIIDEFDELGYELYVPNNKSETFFNNLRGLNNKSQSIGIILVGSENMPKIYNWHGHRLNNWKNRQIDTFDIKTELDIYKSLIENPIAPYLKYNDEAIYRIYSLSGGNPYFTNMICSWIFDIAYDKKDTYITEQEVDEAISIKLKKEAKTSFQHFWVDGILETPSKKDFISDLRRRTLRAISDAMNSKIEKEGRYDVTLEEIRKKFINPPSEIKISRNECENQIRDFITRGILLYNNLIYRLTPELFEIWLIKYGDKEIIEGISDIENIVKEQEIDEQHKITEEEINTLNKKFRYNEEIVTTDTIKEWLNQFDTHYLKRYLFNLINNIYYFDNDNLVSIFKKFSKAIFKDETITLGKNIGLKRFRMENVILTYMEHGMEDNEKIAKKYSKHLMIPYDKVHSTSSALKKIDKQTKYLILLEPVLDNYDKLSDLLETLKITYLDDTDYKDLNIHIISILSIGSSEMNFKKLIKEEYNKISFTSYKNVETERIKPFINIEDKQILKALNRFNNLQNNKYDYKNCINILFDCICPQYSLPFYWYSNNFFPLFSNTNPLYFINEDSTNELYRDKCYQIGKELEQAMLKIIKEILQKKYGSKNNDWWVKGVPINIRQKCAVRREDEDQTEHESSYLEFLEFSGIAKDNFEEMKGLFFYDNEKEVWTASIGREKGTSWLGKLNKTRRKYAHVVKSPPDNDEYEFLKNITKSFINNAKQNNAL